MRSILSHIVVSFLCQVPCSGFSPDKLLGTNFGVAGLNATYDYVIVGGGTAGLAIATRLAQQNSFSVAVIEAGGFNDLENSNLSQVPAFALNSAQASGLTGFNPLIDWRFETTRQIGIGDRVLHYARGKCLGGSSARNNMVFNRATKRAMSKWADEVGDSSYLWENVEQFYAKSAQLFPPNEKHLAANVSIKYDQAVMDASYGPVNVGYSNYIYSIGSYASGAFDEVGLHGNERSFSSGELLGHQYNLYTIAHEDQTRSSSQTAYLSLALEQTNLVVYTQTFAKRILFNSRKKATGVLVEAGSVPFEISAHKEVILAAGAIQSPQLLMVSGIGPSETLEQYDIPVIADRQAVGSNLQDNIAFGPSFEMNLESTAVISNPESAGPVAEEYLMRRKGPLTNTGADYIAYGRVSDGPWANLSESARQKLASTFPPDWPEVELLVNPSYLGDGTGPPDAKNYLSITAALTASLSRGNVTIQSVDMAVHPVFDPNWLSDPVDAEVAVAAFKLARAFFHTQAIRPVIIGSEVWPGEDVSTDAEILEYIRSTCLTIWHACCTSAMGKRDDPMAVVDSQARVVGVDGLRVIDASSFPFLPPGQPQGTIYMLAEKIANDILNDTNEGDD